MKKLFMVISILLSTASILGCGQSELSINSPAELMNSVENTVTIADQTFYVEVAADLESRKIGLMHVPKLAADQGMLFVFEWQGQHSFWMKNTLIPLDMVFIDQDKQVVDLHTAQPCKKNQECPSYTSKAKSRYVLEVNAGTFSEEIIGSKVEINWHLNDQQEE
jgi:uncharacterized membrane protein (UPF0127 family)